MVALQYRTWSLACVSERAQLHEKNPELATYVGLALLMLIVPLSSGLLLAQNDSVLIACLGF